MRFYLTLLFAALLSFSVYAAELAPNIAFRALDNNGDPCSGCLLYTYEAGTTTNKTTYSDAGETTPNTNPVVLDSNGYADVWLGDGSYKLVLNDSDDALIRTLDDVRGSFSAAFGREVSSIATNTSITTAYENHLILTTSSPTLTPDSAAVLGEGFIFAVKNVDSGTTTINPDGSETIDGSATLTLIGDAWAIIYSDGENWYTTGFSIDDGSIAFAKLDTDFIADVTPSGFSFSDILIFGDADNSYDSKSVTGTNLFKAINDRATATITGSDVMLVLDVDDTNTPKKVTAQAVADLNSPDYGAGYAAIGTDVVGSLVFAEVTTGGPYSLGDTISGGNLIPTSATTDDPSPPTLTGTWTCLGYADGTGSSSATLWKKTGS